MTRALRLLMFAAPLALCLPDSGAAQGTGCRFLPPTENAAQEEEFGQIKFVVVNPNILCDDGRQIQAEEMVTYQSSGLTVFSGNVFFQDTDQTLRAFSANYYEREGRLEASGNVELIDLETGTELTGLSMVYLRAGFAGREVERIRVYGGQPRALLFPQATPPDSLPAPPMGDSAQIADSLAMLDSAQVGDSAQVPDSAQVGDSMGVSNSVVVTATDSVSVLEPEPDSAMVEAPVVDSIPAAPADTIPPEPYEVFGDEIEIRGTDYFRARGDVQILRDSLDARADSLEYIQTEARLYLDGNAFVDQPTLDLSAREIMMLLPGDVLTDLVARGDGRLLGDRIDLAAPFIRVELREGEVQGLWAAPLYRDDQDVLEIPLRTTPADAEPDSVDFARPFAVSETVSMTGDSLDVRAPEQVLERVIAIGSARAVSSARDSLNTEDTPDVIRNDWIEGDTVVAVFVRRTGEDGEPLTPGDSIDTDRSEFVLDRLEATGESARSLYRLLPAEDSEPGPIEPTPADSVIVLGQPADTTADPAVTADPPPDSVSVSGATDGAATPRTTRKLAIHYVVANRIVIRMENGQVTTMEVRGLQRGMHQEPIVPPPGTPAPPGSRGGDDGGPTGNDSNDSDDGNGGGGR